MQTRQQTLRQRETEAATAGLQGTRVAGSAQAKKSDTRPGSLARDPAPRRGVPVEKAFSITNTSVRNGNQSQGEEDGDSDNDDAESDSGAEAPDSKAGEADEEMQQFLTDIRPDLERATAELMKHLKQDPDNEVHRRVFGVKNAAFMGLRGKYQEADTVSILIDWTKPGVVHNLVQADASAIDLFARVNQVAALHHIQRIQAHGSPDKQAFLQTLDSSFPALFKNSDPVDPCPEIVVKIRACYFIEILAHFKTKAQALDAVAHVFCKTSGNVDSETLRQNGPYRSLGEGDEKDQERCSTVVETIKACMSTPKKSLWLETLRQKFPLAELLGDLKQWMERMYEKLAQEGDRDFVPDDQEDSDGSDGSDDEIVRVDPAEPIESLFVNVSSLRRLEAIENRASMNRSRDYQQQSSSNVPHSSPLEAAPGPSNRGTKRVYHDVASDSDIEHGRRPLVQRVRRSDIAPWATRASFRVRKPGESRIKKPSKNMASAGPRAPASPSSSASAPGEVRGIALRKAYSAWSKKDVEVLVKLIVRGGPTYSKIERNYSHLFEVPHSQTALRDKARSIKVNYLLNDNPLPRNFDGVSLEKKGISRLEYAGKNPYRREEDVDADGKPTNTEFLG